MLISDWRGLSIILSNNTPTKLLHFGTEPLRSCSVLKFTIRLSIYGLWHAYFMKLYIKESYSAEIRKLIKFSKYSRQWVLLTKIFGKMWQNLKTSNKPSQNGEEGSWTKYAPKCQKKESIWWRKCWFMIQYKE